MRAPCPTRTRRFFRPTNLAFIATIFLFAATISSGCSEDVSPEDKAECSAETPCPGTQSCLQGRCISRGVSDCTTNADCPGGDYQCVDQVCKLPTPDAGPSGDDDTGAEIDATDTNPTQRDTTSPDGPYVVATSPQEADTDVALDSVISIEFSEAMDPTSLNYNSLLIRDANDRALDAEIAYDPDTHTATLTPTAPLNPAESYQLDIRAGARSAGAGSAQSLGVDPPVTVIFSTHFEESAKHTELARTWAPILYQGIDRAEGEVASEEDGETVVNPARPDADIPTRIDFDGNLSADDNITHSKDVSTPINASIYYSVTESTQYYFLHYLLYYPSRYDGAGLHAEHDFAALTVVVDKASEEMLMSETVFLGQSNETTLGFRPDESPVRVRGNEGGDRNMSAFPSTQLEDGTHFPLNILAGIHEACHWYKSGYNGRCLHTSAQFPGPPTGADAEDTAPTSGVVIRPGDTAQTFGQATRNAETGFWEMTYSLVPIPTGLWGLRGRYNQDGLFDLSFTYDPLGENRPTGVPEEQSLRLPKNLQTDEPNSFGRMPFTWLATPTQSNQGQWLLDPAYIINSRFNLGTNSSTDYCYNFYLDIDNRGDAAHPECQN